MWWNINRDQRLQAISHQSIVFTDLSASGLDDLKRDRVNKQLHLGGQTWDYVDLVKQKLWKNNDDYVERNPLKHSLFI